MNPARAAAQGGELPVGVLARQQIQQLAREGALRASSAFAEGQFQPNSLDLRLGPVAHRIRCSFMPQNRSVAEALDELTMYSFSLEDSAVLERGQIYLIPLLEELALPDSITAKANPKSSTGRLDVFSRLLSDHHHRFEELRAGYHGPLWLEVFPRTFPIRVESGLSLAQLRFFSGDARIGDIELTHRIESTPLLFDDEGQPYPAEQHQVEGGLYMGIDLEGEGEGAVIGYRAVRHSEVVDLRRIGQHRAEDFWAPIHAGANRPLILEPEEFYLFASRQRIALPADISAEMIPYDTASGELRTHYAGFLDSGFGLTEPRGARVVLEVRSHDVPFQVTHDQRFFRLVFGRNSRLPNRLYGEGGSHYQRQGLALSKHFTTA